MNNVSFPEDWGKKERKHVEIHWHPCICGEPREKDVYLVTIGLDGIGDVVMSSDWNGEMWSTEAIGEVTAWAHYPLGYLKEK